MSDIEKRLAALLDQIESRLTLPEVRMMRIAEVSERCGMGRTKIGELVKAGAFPAPRLIGAQSIAWRSDEIAAWMAALPLAAAADQPQGDK